MRAQCGLSFTHRDLHKPRPNMSPKWPLCHPSGAAQAQAQACFPLHSICPFWATNKHPGYEVEKTLLLGTFRAAGRGGGRRGEEGKMEKKKQPLLQSYNQTCRRNVRCKQSPLGRCKMLSVQHAIVQSVHLQLGW